MLSIILLSCLAIFASKPAYALEILNADNNQSLTSISLFINQSEMINQNPDNSPEFVNLSVVYDCNINVIAQSNYSQYNMTGNASLQDIYIDQQIYEITDSIVSIEPVCIFNIFEYYIKNVTISGDNQSNENLSLNTSSDSSNSSYANYTITRTLILNASKNIIIDNQAPIINIAYETNNESNAATMIINADDLTYALCNLSINNLNSSLTHEYSFYNSTAYYINDTGHTYSVNCLDMLNNSAFISGNISFNISNNALNNNTANNTNSSINESLPFFEITLDNTAINLGQTGLMTINANNYSNVSLTICPIAQGWVQCYLIPEFINETYPKQQIMPYGNKTGSYLIEGIMHYKNYTIRTNLTFQIVNTLVAHITASDDNPMINKIVIFNASAEGGIGNYNFKWTMPGNTIFYGPGAYKNFSSSGKFIINLTVNDSHNNVYLADISINVKPLYELKIITSDQKTNAKMGDVIVSIDDFNSTTNSNGEVIFRLVEGRYDVYASKNKYGSMINDLKLDENITLYMNMTFIDVQKPGITLLTENKTLFSGNVRLKFKANDEDKLYCELYIAEQESSWFELKDYGGDLLVNTEYTFELTDIDLGNYVWKITCKDSSGNIANSEERTFTQSDQAIASELQGNSETNYATNRALDNIYSLTGYEQEVAELLGIKKALKEILDKSNGLDRDIGNLAFRRDLDEQGKKLAQEQLIKNLQNLKANTPNNLKVTSSKTFVKYAREEDLKNLIDLYLAKRNINIKPKIFLEAVKRTQSKATISTKASNIVLYYEDGRSSEITLISKELSIPDSADDAYFNQNHVTIIEVIPKTVAQDVKYVNIINKEFSVIQDDPILELPGNTKSVNYFINKSVDLLLVQDTDTIIIDKNVNIENFATGFSVLGMGAVKDISLDGKTILIIVIILLIIIYLLMSIDVINKIKILFTNSKKKISYMKVLINDALDQLKIQEYDKAALIYREIRLNYEASNSAIQRQVFDEAYDLCNKMDIYYFDELYEAALEKLKIESDMANIYDKMYMTLDKIDDKYKQNLRMKLMEIKQKMDMLKASNQAIK